MSPDPPMVRKPATELPTQREAWLLAGALYRLVPEGWTVVGGQMIGLCQISWTGVLLIRPRLRSEVCARR